jgi:hypothetical protein
MAAAPEDKSWQILVIRRNGSWFGFRTPLESLRRVANYFSLVFAIAVVGTAGWLLSRWQMHRLDRQMAFERLEAKSQIEALRRGGASVDSSAPRGTSAPEGAAWLPGLDAVEVASPAVTAKDFSALYEVGRRELSVKFELSRTPPIQGPARYYWIVLLHGAPGVLVLPPSLASQAGEALVYHRGQLIEDLRTRKDVMGRFQVGGFVESAQAEPVFASLLVYDDKGSLLVRRRSELSVKRSP